MRFTTRPHHVSWCCLCTALCSSVFMPVCIQISDHQLTVATGEASPDFTIFLDMLAERIELKDWPHFSGGLHVSGSLTGQFSYYTDYKELEVMFHVATLLPLMNNDPQQVRSPPRSVRVRLWYVRVLGVSSVCLCPVFLFSPTQTPQLERKRHLGNDIVMFVFMDEGCKEPFDPSQIRSQFNHIFIVVQPERRKGVTRYKCDNIITLFVVRSQGLTV